MLPAIPADQDRLQPRGLPLRHSAGAAPSSQRAKSPVLSHLVPLLSPLISLSSVLSPLVLLLWFICFLSSPPSLLYSSTPPLLSSLFRSLLSPPISLSSLFSSSSLRLRPLCSPLLSSASSTLAAKTPSCLCLSLRSCSASRSTPPSRCGPSSKQRRARRLGTRGRQRPCRAFWPGWVGSTGCRRSRCCTRCPLPQHLTF